MKNFLLIAATVFSFLACEGPPGPEGPAGQPGQNGQDGINILSEVFEVTVDFNANNNYANLFTLDPPIYDSDVILAYRLWEVSQGTDVWRLIPQTLFLQEGVFQYNYDFTAGDFSLIVSSSIDPSDWSLADAYLTNQTFRIVIVPGAFSGRVDYSDYKAVMEMIGATEADVMPFPTNN